MVAHDVTVVAPASKTRLVQSAQTHSLEEKEVQPRDSIAQVSKGPRKSVSIILPNEENG